MAVVMIDPRKHFGLRIRWQAKGIDLRMRIPTDFLIAGDALAAHEPRERGEIDDEALTALRAFGADPADRNARRTMLANLSILLSETSARKTDRFRAFLVDVSLARLPESPIEITELSRHDARQFKTAPRSEWAA